MSVVIVTGSCGLIGSETVSFFCRKKFDVIGIDNNMRKFFFGEDGSIAWNRRRLLEQYRTYRHVSADIRNASAIERIMRRFGRHVVLIVHAAAQPSHDWAARDPVCDFTVNANGTLILLEAFRRFAPSAAFIFTSTNKVYGDRPNTLPVIERRTRYELPPRHRSYRGIDETMSIDCCLHSLFGASKASADILTQEYGRYFGLKTAIFRGGCLTGPAHSGAELHGFLSYLMKCCILGRTYRIFGYKGKQVRDNIHSFDLVNAFYHFFRAPRSGEVYNMGGGRFANVSIIEAMRLCEAIAGKKIAYEYVDKNRTGDHIWWISDISKFQRHYPRWKLTYGIEETLREIYETQKGVLKR